jgi:DNA polymerase epsilon subunit 2
MFQVKLSDDNDPLPSDAEIVVLSDVHLDSSKVMEKLRTMLLEFSEQPPSMFIMAGNFTSTHGSIEDCAKRLSEGFEYLTEMIVSFPNIINHSEFIFVPGPNDPAGIVVNVLPKSPLPANFVRYMKEKIPKARFTSNPCR